MYPLLNSVYAKTRLPLQLKIKLSETTQRYGGPKIGFSFGNSLAITPFSIFMVKNIYQIKFLIT